MNEEEEEMPTCLIAPASSNGVKWAAPKAGGGHTVRSVSKFSNYCFKV